MVTPPASARDLDVGAGKPFATPSAANAAAAPGDRILIAPGQYTDCAVLSADGLVVEGSGDAAQTVLSGKACRGKALLVVDGANITIRNLTLARARVPDGNGAGIRAEGGNLTVENTRFIGNQDGLLTNDRPDMVVTVRHSMFVGNGVCLALCSHAIYAGRIAALVVRDSIFRDTKQGHHIKSRAARTEITGCDIADGPDGTASYLIEAPNGGAVIIRGNTLQKGPQSGNPRSAISIGAEGVTQATPEITVRDNRFTNDGSARTTLVNNLTATVARLQGNSLTGDINALHGPGSIR